MSDDSLFCTECGKQISQGIVCPYCGASVNDGDVFCQNCGKSLTELPSNVTDSARRKCPLCGAEINDGDVFCENCGAKLDAVDSTAHKDDTIVLVQSDNVQNELTDTYSSSVYQTDYPPQTNQSSFDSIKGPIIWALCILLLIGGAVGGWYYYKTTMAENEQTQWEKIKDTEDLNELENFLRQYPNGNYNNLAKERTNYVQEEISLWNNVVRSSNPDELKGFIKKYKKGYYHDLSVEAYDERLWSEATRKNDLESYKHYLEECPQGKYYQQAKDKADYHEKTSLDDEEAGDVIAVVSQFVHAIARGDEDTMLECLSSDIKVFMGKTGATKVDAIAYMHKIHADDVYSIDVTMGESEINKTLDSEGETQYTVNFSFDQRLNREDTSLETFATYKGTAILNGLRRITSLSMNKTAKY